MSQLRKDKLDGYDAHAAPITFDEDGNVVPVDVSVGLRFYAIRKVFWGRGHVTEAYRCNSRFPFAITQPTLGGCAQLGAGAVGVGPSELERPTS